MSQPWLDHVIHDDFLRARRRAVFGQLYAMLRGRSNDLLPFEEVRLRLNIRGQRYLGHRAVPITQIVGSEGRYSDFDRHFLPRHEATRMRWLSIDRAHHSSVELPPIELYKLGDIYFVKDGNHRVSVALQQGQAFIDAYVTELEVDVPLDSSLSSQDLLLMEEYSDFLEWTELNRLRPEQRIRFSEPGGYLELVKHINGHRYFLGKERNAEVSRDEAVASWYDNVYMPIIQEIRELNLLAQFPRRTEADLYLWIIDHRWHMFERQGVDPGAEAATRDYLQVARPGMNGWLTQAADKTRLAVRRMFESLLAPLNS